MTTINMIANRINNTSARSAWTRGVKLYALELMEEYTNNYGSNACAPCMTDLLNGARDWSQYSYGGCALICDGDIAERLCTRSELIKTRHGDRRPNSSEKWLDVQARALWQAAKLILDAARAVEEAA